MRNKSNRIIYVLGATLLAIVLILSLSYIGGKTKGPIEGIFARIGSQITEYESNIILKHRKNKRSDDLHWVAGVRNERAFFLHPKAILLGAFDNESHDSFENIINFEDSLRTKFPLVHIYTAWGSKAEQQFPEKHVKAIIKMGSVPVITWEPWLSDFDKVKFPYLRPADKRDAGGLADIANGLYDNYLMQWAGEAKKVNSLIFLRVGHEMNDPYRYPWGPQNNKAEDFVAAWKHIHGVFENAGAENIIWVWSPHPAYGWFDFYYPGDEYVDYVGVGILNYGTVASWSQWWSFDAMFGKHYDELKKYGKPMMITEFGSLAVGGDRQQWFADALSGMPSKYPALKSLIFFHYSEDKTTTQQPLNWYIKNDTALSRTIASQLEAWPDSLKPAKR